MGKVLKVTAQHALVIDLGRLALQKYFGSSQARFADFELRDSLPSKHWRWVGIKGRIAGVHPEKLSRRGWSQGGYVDVEYTRTDQSELWTPYKIIVLDSTRVVMAVYYSTQEFYEQKAARLGPYGFSNPVGYFDEIPTMQLLSDS
jgi:hypothetical protein